MHIISMFPFNLIQNSVRLQAVLSFMQSVSLQKTRNYKSDSSIKPSSIPTKTLISYLSRCFVSKCYSFSTVKGQIST